MAMSEPAGKRPSIGSTVSFMLSAWRDPAARILNLDLLAVLIALLLPWTTSGVAIVAVIWVVALAPTLDPRAFVRLLRHPICYLPVALFALALFGTLWSDAEWEARAYALTPAAKLLMLPLLLLSFRAIDPGHLGLRRVSGVLHAVAGDVLGRRIFSRSRPQAGGAIWRSGEELYRPEPVVRALRGGAGLSRHNAAAERAGNGRRWRWLPSRCCSSSI